MLASLTVLFRAQAQARARRVVLTVIFSFPIWSVYGQSVVLPAQAAPSLSQQRCELATRPRSLLAGEKDRTCKTNLPGLGLACLAAAREREQEQERVCVLLPRRSLHVTTIGEFVNYKGRSYAKKPNFRDTLKAVCKFTLLANGAWGFEQAVIERACRCQYMGSPSVGMIYNK